MGSIKIVDEKSPYLDEVKRIWGENRATLGYFPDGAFLGRAQKGQILAAIDSNKVAGYAIYSINRKMHRIRLNHLCVDKKYQGRGIARQLVNELRNQTKSFSGIGLYCRRDYEISNMWPKLGFVAVSEKIGRSSEGHELTYFWMQHAYKNLFSSVENTDDDRMKISIDANIFYDTFDPTRDGADETSGLMADWIQPSIQICINDELLNEIHRIKDSEQRKERLSKARSFDILDCNTDDFLVANEKVRSLLGCPDSERDDSDQRHLARTMASDSTVFVTRDGPILDVSDKIYDEYGLSVMRPSELIAHFEELRNERDYQHARLVGTPLKFSRTNSNVSKLAEQFQDQTSGETKRELAKKLNRAFAHPDIYECHLVETREGEPQSLHVVEKCNGNLLEIPIFRIAKSVLNTRLASTLARTLLSGIVQSALQSDISVVRLTEQFPSPILKDALQSTGFFPTGNTWLKLSVIDVSTVKGVLNKIEEIADTAGVDPSFISHILEILNDESFPTDISRVLDMEHILWPGKFIGCAVPNYLISIKPRWASDLFDAGLAKDFLWGADTELALNPESVYYRAKRPSMRTKLGRILWYVSSDSKIIGSKRVRACSQLRDVVVGHPKELYKQYRRLGVYQWQNVLNTAGTIEGELMALEFFDTELFSNPVDWDSLQSILQRFSVRTTLQSPIEIGEDAFVEIYRLGLESPPSKR